MLENTVWKEEPSLFQTYKTLYRYPERRKQILDNLESRLGHKRKALNNMESIIKHKRFLYNLSVTEKPKQDSSPLPVAPLWQPRGLLRRNAATSFLPVFGNISAPPVPRISDIDLEWCI